MAFAQLLKRMKAGQFTSHGFRSAFRDWARGGRCQLCLRRRDDAGHPQGWHCRRRGKAQAAAQGVPLAGAASHPLSSGSSRQLERPGDLVERGFFSIANAHATETEEAAFTGRFGYALGDLRKPGLECRRVC